jgi:hypothetical protein
MDSGRWTVDSGLSMTRAGIIGQSAVKKCFETQHGGTNYSCSCGTAWQTDQGVIPLYSYRATVSVQYEQRVLSVLPGVK